MLQFKRHKCIKTGFPVSLQAYQPRQGRKPSGRFFFLFLLVFFVFCFFFSKLFCVLCNFFSFGMNLRLTIETAFHLRKTRMAHYVSSTSQDQHISNTFQTDE